jgi:hypothetical protein
MAEPLTSIAWVYGLEDPDGNLCYAGSTRSHPPRRLTSHQRGCRSDPLRSPLTRWAVQRFGGMDGFKIVVLQTLTVPRDDDEMLHQAEATAIATLRAQGCELQNHNAPRLVSSPRRREQMRQWRLAHPGYMSAAGKRHYRLRKARAQAMATAAARVVAAEQGEAAATDVGDAGP